jgi:hypothetical protein
MFAKAGIHRHLKTHLKQKEAENERGKSYLLKVEGCSRNFSAYFLSLWVDGETEMEEIDNFLRDIWLECCGHLSAFTSPQAKPQNVVDEFHKMQRENPNMEALELFDKWLAQNQKESNEIPMTRKAKAVFSKAPKLKYEYDFGSTTSLQLIVLGEYKVKADDRIVLLSRNEPLDWLCDSCKKLPATQICTAEWDGEIMFCDKCAKKHDKTCPDFEDCALPVVNSPRMGICSYTGGCIDQERDEPDCF